MGTTEEIFQLDGGQQLLMERLKRLVTEGAIALAVDFSMRADIKSGPLTLFVSKEFSSS